MSEKTANFVNHINNTEFDSNGNPVWHESAVIAAINWYASQLTPSLPLTDEEIERKAEEVLYKGIRVLK
jgi:hypothetical protein